MGGAVGGRLVPMVTAQVKYRSSQGYLGMLGAVLVNAKRQQPQGKGHLVLTIVAGAGLWCGWGGNVRGAWENRNAMPVMEN